MQVDTAVMTVLSRAVTVGNALTLVGDLERTLYVRTNKVLEAAGGVWKRGMKAHVFQGDANDAIEQILLTGQITVAQNFGYFPTPAPIVARLLQLAHIEPGMVVLEPSAGQGAIARPVSEITTVDGIELLQGNADKLQAGGYLRDLVVGDFLVQEPVMKYDRVVSNPPFSKQADIHHVNHALKFLKPDGLLVSVMAAGILFRENRLTNEFRDLINSRHGSIEEIEDGAFKSSGTMVRTVIVTIPAA